MQSNSEINQIIAELYKSEESKPLDKNKLKLAIWKNSIPLVRYQLRRNKIDQLFDDVSQTYFEILETHLQSYDPTKGDFSYWNYMAIKNAITRVIRLTRPYETYKEKRDGLTIQRYRVRTKVEIDNNKLLSHDTVIEPDSCEKIINLLLSKRLLTIVETLILHYRFQEGFGQLEIGNLLGLSRANTSRIYIKAMGAVKNYAKQNPEKFGV